MGESIKSGAGSSRSLSRHFRLGRPGKLRGEILTKNPLEELQSYRMLYPAEAAVVEGIVDEAFESILLVHHAKLEALRIRKGRK